MTVKGVLWRFLLIYAVLIVVAGLVINYFGIKSNNGINVGLLAGSVMWVCAAFGKKNRRYFSSSEKTTVVLGLIAINLFLQFFFVVAALSRSPAGFNLNALIFALGFIGVLHSVGIYFFVGLAKKPLIKQGIIDG